MLKVRRGHLVEVNGHTHVCVDVAKGLNDWAVLAPWVPCTTPDPEMSFEEKCEWFDETHGAPAEGDIVFEHHMTLRPSKSPQPVLVRFTKAGYIGTDCPYRGRLDCLNEAEPTMKTVGVTGSADSRLRPRWRRYAKRFLGNE